MPGLYVPILSNGGTVFGQYMVGYVKAFSGRRIIPELVSDPNSANVLNRATHSFLKTSADEMVIIDADVEVTKGAIDMLFEHDFPVVWGWYAKKSFPMEACTGGLDDADRFRPDGAVQEMRWSGRGLMRIHRSVFADLERAERINVFRNMGPEPIKEFWKAGAHPETEEFEHEDMNMCRRLRAIGHRVMVDTRCQGLHWGHWPFGIIPETEDSTPSLFEHEPANFDRMADPALTPA